MTTVSGKKDTAVEADMPEEILSNVQDYSVKTGVNTLRESAVSQQRREHTSIVVNDAQLKQQNFRTLTLDASQRGRQS